MTYPLRRLACDCARYSPARTCACARSYSSRAVAGQLRRFCGGQGFRVELRSIPKGPLPDHFADIMDVNSDMVGNVALDSNSFKALKDHWMRCKYEEQSS